MRERGERVAVRPGAQCRGSALRRGLRVVSAAGSFPLGRGGQSRWPARPGQLRAPLISLRPVLAGRDGSGALWLPGGARSAVPAPCGGWARSVFRRGPQPAGLRCPERARGAAPPRRARVWRSGAHLVRGNPPRPWAAPGRCPRLGPAPASAPLASISAVAS